MWEDGAGEGPQRGLRLTAHQTAVLRGARLELYALRVGLPAATPDDTHRGEQEDCRAAETIDFQRGVPPEASASRRGPRCRTRSPILLIDEIDRADEEFEGFLLEFLAEFQVTIPELGTLKAKQRPIVVITSNRTRELGDGLRRRCLYLYVSFPTPEKELRIVELKVPHVQERLARQVVEMMAKIRSLDDVVRKPGTAETLDWVSALVALGKEELNATVAEQTLSCVLKSSDELSRLKGERLASLLSKTGTGDES